MSLTEHKDLLEALSYFATILGIPIAIAAFLYEKRKERLQREIETYIEANQRYIEYLTLCLEYPELDCGEFLSDDKDAVAAGLSVGKLTMFTILVSLLEGGYVLYRSHQGAIRKKQWRGWSDYMDFWASRQDFRKAWPLLGSQFDTDFVEHMQNYIDKWSNQSAQLTSGSGTEATPTSDCG